MYSAGPPRHGDAAPLGISRVERRIFDGPSDLAADQHYVPLLRAFLTDLLRPYGMEFSAPGRAQSYGQMAETVMDLAVAPEHPVDLVLLAFAIHDITPGRATATYLSHLRPGNHLAFAICDQGAAAAFTGLRLIREYIRTGDCRQALLIVVEQAELPYSPTAPVTIPTVHAAVALLCGDHAGEAPGGWVARLAAIRQHADVAEDDARRVLTDEVAALSAGRTEVTLVVGGGLAAQSPVAPNVGRLRAAPAGQPTTGVWWELAEELYGYKTPDAGVRRVLLADHDPALRYLSLCAIDLSG